MKKETKVNVFILQQLDLVSYFSLPKNNRLRPNEELYYDLDNTIQNKKPNSFRFGGYRD